MTTSQPQVKPRCEVIRPELTRLPRQTFRRRAIRMLLRWVFRLAVRLCARFTITGLQNFPQKGPALIVINHLGDADVILGMAYLPRWVEGLAKSELYDLWFIGRLLNAYGVIWVHRGQPDRKAIRSALMGLSQGRLVAIAPEGRESLTGSLELGTGGAAYLALKADVPIVPITFTGTENWRVFGNLKKFRRTQMSMTIGEPFRIVFTGNRRDDVQRGTEHIMRTLADQLPHRYRGVYAQP